jgi:energy-coupling factor transporter ATP-binding protein EcfA2
MTATIWSYQDNFDFFANTEQQDKFYVPLEGQRGVYARQKILSEYKLDSQGDFRPGQSPQSLSHILFGGHIGSGKSTELRQLAKLLQKNYTVSVIEISQSLDINNLRFSDLLIALAGELAQKFEGYHLQPSPLFLDPVLNWFETRIVRQDHFTDLSAELKTTAEGKVGIPFFIKLMATITAKISSGASYREELRHEVQNGFTQLVAHFNALIAHANDLLQQQGKGRLLFIIDGTDKLKREDSKGFFDSDVNQLGQISTNLLVCAPISVLLEEGATAQRFARRERLPMVKIYDRDETENDGGVNVLVEMVLRRMPLEFFDDMETVKYLVRQSGGHPRDLIRLVRNCFSLINGERITLDIAKRSVQDIAAEYERDVQSTDWADLVLIDQSKGEEKGRTDNRLRLLYSLVLLEYNNYWWRSHPLVRQSAAYRKALASAAQAPSK